MSTATLGVPTYATFYRISVENYHRMIEAGILTEDDNLELLEGYLVPKMSQNPPHASSVQRTRKRIERILPSGWDTGIGLPITLTDSEPEPDISVVRGEESTYQGHHPGPGDLGLVIEVADSTLQLDRGPKARLSARAVIAVYWIINLLDRQVEVHTHPSGASANPGYGKCDVFKPGMSIPLVLDGTTSGQLAVDDLIP